MIIEYNEKLVKEIENDIDFKFALEIVNALEEEFDIEIPDIEFAYICLHLKCAKMQFIEESDSENSMTDQEEELLELAHEIIIAYDEVLSSTLETDEEFVKGLLAHLKPTLIRVRNSFPIVNQHLDEIKGIYPDIFKRCEYVGKFLEAKTGYKFPEAEIGFLATHFGAAIVRMENEKEKKRKVRIGLVCASGIGISRLMSSRIEKYFGLRISITTYGEDDLTPFVKTNTDFFISSVDIEDTESDIIYVSPLLPENDLKMIEIRVAKYEKITRKQDFDYDFTKQLEKINYLSAKIKYVLKEFRCIQVGRDLDFRQFLHKVLHTVVGTEVFVNYIEADIRKREEIATQVIPQLGIGLFHTRTKGVLNPCVYVCVNEEREAFTNPYLQKMQAAIIMLVPQDDHAEDNSRMLGSISEKLFEDENLLKVIKTGEQEMIRKHLNDILKQYFQRYLNEI